ncbi:MAG: hypothetical protein ACPGYP_03910 [Solirubrobacterales bacterium]
MKTKRFMRAVGLSATAAVLLIATSAATSPQTSTRATAAADRNQAVAAGGKRVRLGSTRYGKILQDSRGRTLYLFTRDKRKKSRCYGDCARAWPPLVTNGRPVAIRGARQRELGTVRRGGGKRQVTYNGHPLYYYVDEDEPNEVLCQAVTEFGGVWYVVNRAGKAIRKR